MLKGSVNYLNVRAEIEVWDVEATKNSLEIRCEERRSQRPSPVGQQEKGFHNYLTDMMQFT